MKLKAALTLGLFVTAACAQSSKQPVPQSTPPKTTEKSEDSVEDGREADTNGGDPTFNENDKAQQTATQPQQPQQKADPLASLSPELRAKLNPAQISALSALTPQQLQALTSEQLAQILQANGGLPATTQNAQAGNSALTSQLLSQLTGLLSGGGIPGQLPPGQGQFGQNGQGQFGQNGQNGQFGQDEEFGDDFEFE